MPTTLHHQRGLLKKIQRADLHRFWLTSVRAPGNSGSSKNRFTVTFLRKIKRATSRFTWALKETSTRKGRQRRGRDFIRRQLQPSCRHGDERCTSLRIGRRLQQIEAFSRMALELFALTLWERSQTKKHAPSLVGRQVQIRALPNSNPTKWVKPRPVIRKPGWCLSLNPP